MVCITLSNFIDFLELKLEKQASLAGCIWYDLVMTIKASQNVLINVYLLSGFNMNRMWQVWQISFLFDIGGGALKCQGGVSGSSKNSRN